MKADGSKTRACCEAIKAADGATVSHEALAIAVYGHDRNDWPRNWKQCLFGFVDKGLRGQGYEVETVRRAGFRMKKAAA